MQRKAHRPYPPELRGAIIEKNYPLLQRNQSSYPHQIELAAKRGDQVSVNHRVAALLASYFDVLFAVNELPHPGEKRLLQHAASSCSTIPAAMERQVTELVASMGRSNGRTVEKVNALVDLMDELIVRRISISRGIAGPQCGRPVGNFDSGTVV